MNSERWRRVEALCDQALAICPDERASFLDAACEGDNDLRREVEALLAREPNVDAFLRSSTLASMVREALSESADARAGPGSDDTPHPGTFRPNDLVAARFRVVRRKGIGGMGEVYEAEDLMLHGDHVALKTFRAFAASDERSVELLKREIAAARRVTHPNVCRVFDVYQHETAEGPITFYSMELLKGETLAARLECGRMDRETARSLLGQIAAGLDAAHGARVVHGDFKPGNVMLEPGSDGHERAVITDFGLARIVPPNTVFSASESATSRRWGTPGYMAPERYERRSVTPAIDIYALGIVAHEMITGGRPFDSTSSPRREPVDPRWRKAIQRCLERDPTKRFQTALDFVRALDAPVSDRSFSRRWLIGLGGMAAIGLTGLLLRSSSGPFLRSAPLLNDRVVAVMPFTSQSETAEGQAYGRGLSAALTDELRFASRVDTGSSRVMVVPAVELLEADFKTAKEAQRILGANVLLTGRVDRDGGRTAITVSVDESDAPRASPERDQKVEAAADTPLVSGVVPRLTTLVGLSMRPRSLELLTSQDSRVREAEDSYLLGRGFLVGGAANLDAAVDAFQRAIRLDPGYAIAYAFLSDAYLRKYRATRDATFVTLAESAADDAIAQGPSIAYAHVIRGRAYLASGQDERAIRELEAALRFDPSVVDARRSLAEAHEAEGDLRAAEDVYRQDIAAYPHYWAPHTDFGSFLIKHGRYREAETSLVNGVRYAPDNTRAIGNLAGLYILTERLTAAETELRRVLALKPEVVVCNNLAWVYIYQERFPEAVTLMQQAVQLPRADSFHWGNLARAYRWAGRSDPARATYEKAIRLARQELSRNPRDTRIRGNFAQMLAETGQAAEALVEVAATIERAPKDVSILFRSAIVSELTGDRPGALRALEAALRGGYSVVDVRRHPDLARLRTDQRFVEVIRLASSPAAQ